jgi:predicted dehydrogenase
VGTSVATFAVHGTGGSAWSEDDGSKLYLQNIDERDRRAVPVEPTDALAEQLAEFASCIKANARPEVDGHVGLEVVAVLEAGALSASRGSAVEVDEVRQAKA